MCCISLRKTLTICSEYLFLLTILIKPQSGFKIAFAMLDRDGNERIDKKEFKVDNFDNELYTMLML